MDYFDYNASSDFDIEEFLEQSQEQEKQRLQAELERIEQQLEQRDDVHEEVMAELESKLDWYVDRLETLYQRQQGQGGERDQVKTRIAEFYREIREEIRQRWEDKQRLERQRRELLRDFEELDDEDLLSELL